jgi:leucyl aminopeptidase
MASNRQEADAREAFDPIPTFRSAPAVVVVDAAPSDVGAIGVPVGRDGAVPASTGLDRAALARHGFTGDLGETLVVPTAGPPTLVLVGLGDDLSSAHTDSIRTATAAFASAVDRIGSLAFHLPSASSANTAAAVEGIVLVRYRYNVLRSKAESVPVESVALIVDGDRAGAEAGARRGASLARATMIARDLANTPHNFLTATRLAELATKVGPACDVGVEVFDTAALESMSIGGLLAVNQGSVEPPRMIKLSYRPASPTGRLALVGKGVMYDSGGLGIKPNDRVHAQMKNDMSGAAAVLASMLVLSELECRTSVTGYLMCTDNMPSGSALALGDVITIRGGTTVEVTDTDAEGRLVMSDALVLAREDGHDAVVDIATLTGAALRALGPDIAAIFGNDRALTARVQAASAQTGELVWELPLHAPYFAQLKSDTADMINVGYGHAGAITAALFLAEFTRGIPWVHIDMCGPAQVETPGSWLPAGCSGFGARLLAELATAFATS